MKSILILGLIAFACVASTATSLAQEDHSDNVLTISDYDGGFDLDFTLFRSNLVEIYQVPNLDNILFVEDMEIAKSQLHSFDGLFPLARSSFRRVKKTC